MAAVAVTSPARSQQSTITKRPSIKKYKAPTPPRQIVQQNGHADKENTDKFDSKQEENVPNGESEYAEKVNGDESAKKGSQVSIPEGCRTPHSERSAGSRCSSNHSSPSLKDRRLPGNLNNSNNGINGRSSPGGNVLTKAAMFDIGSPKRNTEPALMSLREKKALFEKNKGEAIVPKAAFGMAPSMKALDPENKGQIRKPITAAIKPKIETRPGVIVPTHGGVRAGRVANMAAAGIGLTLAQQAITDQVQRERQEEMRMLQNRFHRSQETDLDHIENGDDDEHSSEESPLMGNKLLNPGHKQAQATPASPKVIIAPGREAHYDEELDGASTADNDSITGHKRRSSMDSARVVSVLEDVKRIRSAEPRPGRLYPCLSDIEDQRTTDEERRHNKPSCLARCGDFALECCFFFFCI